jgi:hypothetical protein
MLQFLPKLEELLASVSRLSGGGAVLWPVRSHKTFTRSNLHKT